MQVAQVNKVLASVGKMCGAGNRVVFDDEEGSYIEDKQSGEITPLHKRNGVYVMDMRIRKGREGAVEAIAQEQEEVFSGLGTDLI